MKLALRIALSIAAIAALFIFVVDAGEVLRVIARFEPAYLVLGLALATADRLLMTFKWTLLLEAQGQRLALLPGVRIYCASMIWGLALPATIGADAIRALMVTRRGLAGTAVVTSIIVERLIGFVVALALGVASLLLLRALGVLDGRFDQLLYAGIAMLAAALALLLASMSPRLAAAALRRVPASWRDSKVMSTVVRLTQAYHALSGARRTLASFSALTSIQQVFSILVPWSVALGLGVSVDLLVLLGVLPICNLISRLPISFDGIGVFEAMFVGLLMLAGLGAEPALAIALAGRIIHLLAFLPWWLADLLTPGAVKPKELGNL